MGQATAQTQIGDVRIPVTRFDFEPGDRRGRHAHGIDHVFTTPTDCNLSPEETGAETREISFAADTANRRDKGPDQNAINGGTAPTTLIETELQ